MLGHPVFRAKIREWLKVMRKANCAVILATQSLSDAKSSGILDVLTESCLTKIFLPNIAARQEGQRELYTGMGLNETQLSIIAGSVPKQDYYLVSPQGRRRVQLALGPQTLAFVGASDKESIARIRELAGLHGIHGWQKAWLEERGAETDVSWPTTASKAVFVPVMNSKSSLLSQKAAFSLSSAHAPSVSNPEGEAS